MIRGTVLTCPYCLKPSRFGVVQVEGVEPEYDFAVIGQTTCCAKNVMVRFGEKMSIEALEGRWLDT